LRLHAYWPGRPWYWHWHFRGEYLHLVANKAYTWPLAHRLPCRNKTTISYTYQCAHRYMHISDTHYIGHHDPYNYAVYMHCTAHTLASTTGPVTAITIRTCHYASSPLFPNSIVAFYAVHRPQSVTFVFGMVGPHQGEHHNRTVWSSHHGIALVV
jgi:hypothetical protein